MKRLPAVHRLADEIRGAGKASPDESAAFLTARRNEIKTYPSIDVLAMYSDAEYAPVTASPEDITAAKALVHHFDQVRSAVAKALWSRQIFVGIDIIDELLFYGARSDSVTDLILECLTRIRDGHMNRPGLVVLPLHSFGVLGAGLLLPLARAQLTIVNPDSGYALFPQSNDLARTMDQLRAAARGLSVKKDMPQDLIEHWHRSRAADWLERNPLLVVKVNHLPGSYYANEHLLLNRVQSVVGLLSLLAALQPKIENRSGALFSTSRMNNWETLDIHHYLALYDSPANNATLDGDCVPIHGGRVEVSELAALGFEIDPKYWRRQVNLGTDIQAVVEKLYVAQLHQKVSGKRPNARERTVAKMFNSLQMFRRSFVGSAGDWTGKVALSTAFEMLLTDSFGGVRTTLVSRSKVLLAGQRGTRAMQQAVSDLYVARSELVHGAAATTSADMDLARRAYALCFLELGRRVDNIPPTSSHPIRDVVV